MNFRRLYTLIFSLLALLVGFTSCGNAPDTPDRPDYPEGSTYRRTVLVYMAAQNSLGADGYAQQDSAEMANGMKYLHPGERVLMFLDDNRPPRLYELRKAFSTPRLVKQWKDELNSADPQTLTSMLDTMQRNYPSETYGLVLWSHATGWIPSPKSVAASKITVGERDTTRKSDKVFSLDLDPTLYLTRNALWTPDEGQTTATKLSENVSKSSDLVRKKPGFSAKSYGMDVGKDGNWSSDVAALGAPADELNINDLAKAITASGVKLRFIHMDCCLMADIQAFYALRNTADYIAASPIEISAIGGYYTDMLRWGYFSEDIKDLGITYTNYYANKGSQPYTDNFGVVFSIVRTDRMQDLANALAAELPQQLPALKTDGTKNFPDMTQTQTYGRYSSRKFWRPHYYDMNDALRRMLPAESWQRVKRAIDAATVYKFTTPRFMTGLTTIFQGAFAPDVIDVDEANFCGISMFVPQQTYTDHAVSNPPDWYRACPHGDLNKQFRKTEWYRAAGWQAAGW